MRALGYDKLVLLCDGDLGDCVDLRRIRTLEEMANHTIEVERIHGTGFMETVEEISTTLTRIRDESDHGAKARVVLNISGGSKLLGDSALFAAFRLGIEAYHCDSHVTRLPILRGATARDMFTQTQLRILKLLDRNWKDLESIVRGSKAQSRQATLRVLRELRKADLVRTEAGQGLIRVALTETGSEAKKAASVAGH